MIIIIIIYLSKASKNINRTNQFKNTYNIGLDAKVHVGLFNRLHDVWYFLLFLTNAFLNDSVVYTLQNWGLVCWEATSGVKSGVLCHSSSVLLRTRDALEWKSRQQLDGCMASSVWAATSRKTSQQYAPFTFTPGCMKTTPVHQRLETPTETDTQEDVYQKPVRNVNELKQHVTDRWSATSRASLIKWLISGKIVLMHVSKPKANTEHLL